MRPLLNLSPKRPKEPKWSLHTFKSNSKCSNFCIWCPNSIKLVDKFALSFLVCVINFSNQFKFYWFFGSQSKFTGSIEFTKLHLKATNLGSYISFIQCLFWIKFVGLCSTFSLVIVVKFPCQSQLFWIFERNLKFKISTFLDYSELWRLISSSYSVCFHKKKYWKSAHTSLVCVVKISHQSKKLWLTKKHFRRRRFSLKCIFCNFSCNFLTFQSHFANLTKFRTLVWVMAHIMVNHATYSIA